MSNVFMCCIGNGYIYICSIDLRVNWLSKGSQDIESIFH